MTGTDNESASKPLRLVRPYMVTRGRVATTDLAMETLVIAVKNATSDGLQDESLAVFTLCAKQIAVAEIAAHASLPLGIATMVVSDLISSGHLEAFATAGANDAAIVKRILHALSQ